MTFAKPSPGDTVFPPLTGEAKPVEARYRARWIGDDGKVTGGMSTTIDCARSERDDHARKGETAWLERVMEYAPP